MACGGYKYNGINFSSKQELKEYLKNGTRPKTDVSLQEVKTQMIANGLSSADTVQGVSDMLIANYGITPQEANQYHDYIVNDNYPGTDKVAAEQRFNGYSQFLKDLETSVDFSNSKGNRPIDVSPEIRQFLGNIKNTNNDSTRFLPTEQRPESSSNEPLPQLEKGKWFIGQEQTEGQGVAPAAEAGGGQNQVPTGRSQTGTTETPNAGKFLQTDTTQRAGAGTTTGNGARDGGQGKADTAEYIGQINGHVQRVRIPNGTFVQWDDTTKSWTGIVTRASGTRFGFVRRATKIEKEAADKVLKEISITKGNVGAVSEMVFGGGMSPMESLRALNEAGLIQVSPVEIYRAAKKSFDDAGIGLDAIVDQLGSERYERLPVTQITTAEIQKSDIYPSKVSDPMSFYRNLGLSDHIAYLASFVYNLVPDAYNKTQKALAITVELLFPSRTGFSVMDVMPYTNEEMYGLDEDYDVKASKNYGKPFLTEFLNGYVRFGFSRNQELLNRILATAKKINFDLPLQYEQYFAAIQKEIPMYQVGDVIRNRKRAFVVKKINYTQDEITYILESEDGGFYQMGLENMDGFDIIPPQLDDELRGLIGQLKTALSEIGVTIVGWPTKMMGRADGIYQPIEKKIIFDVDKFSERTKKVLLHEAAHAIFINGIRIDPSKIKSMHKQIAEVLKNGTPEERKIYNKINDLVSRYTESNADEGKMEFDELLAHEFMAELVAILAYEKKKITSKTERTIIQKLIDMFRNLFSWNQDMGFENINDVIDFINGLSEKMITGEAISFAEYKDLSRGDDNIASGTLSVITSDYLSPGDRASVIMINPQTKRGVPYFDGRVVARGFTAKGDEYVTFDHNKEHGKTYLLKDIVRNGPFYVLNANAVALDGKTQMPGVYEIMGMIRDAALQKNPDGSYKYTEEMFYNQFKDELDYLRMTLSDVVEAFSNLRVPEPPPSGPPSGPPKGTENPTDDDLEDDEDNIYEPPAEPARPSGNKSSGAIFDKISKITNYEEFLTVLKTGEYQSGETIEKKTGAAPLNPQDYVKMRLADAFDYGRSIIADAKSTYGENYVKELLAILKTPGLALQAKALVYMSLENDLHARKLDEPENYDIIVRLQYKTHVDSQENSRNLSLGLNYQRVRQMQRNGTVDVNEVPLKSLTPKQKRGRKKIEESVDTSDSDLNDIVDETDNNPPPPPKPKDPSFFKLNVPKTSKDRRVKSDKSQWVVPDESHMKELEDRIKEFIKKNC